MKRKIQTLHVIIGGKIDNYIVFDYCADPAQAPPPVGEAEQEELKLLLSKDNYYANTKNRSVEMLIKETSKRNFGTISTSSFFLGDPLYQTLFWNSDDEILSAAVDTLGFSNWECVSQIWFESEKTEEQCFKRSIHLKLKQKSKRKIIAHENNYTTSDLDGGVEVDSKLFIKSQRQLEALETRRLFGKKRNEWELDVIHRSYLVGRSKLRKILEMNNISDAKVLLGKDFSISISSLAAQMKDLSQKEVDDSVLNHSILQCNNKMTLKSIPRSIQELEDSKVLSPTIKVKEAEFFNDYDGNLSSWDYQFLSNTMIDLEQQESKEQENHDSVYVLNLKSTDLRGYLEKALEDEIESITTPTPINRNPECIFDVVNNAGETTLEDFSSPKLQYSILPILPITVSPVKPSSLRPKQFFFIR
jgi:hypothetical protein